jgi:hypothetical protein
MRFLILFMCGTIIETKIFGKEKIEPWAKLEVN